MKNILFLSIVLLLYGCVSKTKKTDPNASLSKTEQSDFKYSIVRYYDDIAPKATFETKFDPIFDTYYKKKSKTSDLLFYYFDTEKKTAYFAITKIAPSLKLKKVATVGAVSYKTDGSIKTYEEKFRTWKMPIDELKEKTTLLFTKYLEGEDLNEYYTKNSEGQFFIEFPDETTQYDIKSRKWITTVNY